MADGRTCRRSPGAEVRGERVRFSEAVADLICARVAAGDGMTAVCRDEGMPHPTSVYAWIRERLRRG